MLKIPLFTVLVFALRHTVMRWSSLAHNYVNNIFVTFCVAGRQSPFRCAVSCMYFVRVGKFALGGDFCFLFFCPGADFCSSFPTVSQSKALLSPIFCVVHHIWPNGEFKPIRPTFTCISFLKKYISRSSEGPHFSQSLMLPTPVLCTKTPSSDQENFIRNWHITHNALGGGSIIVSIVCKAAVKE